MGALFNLLQLQFKLMWVDAVGVVVVDYRWHTVCPSLAFSWLQFSSIAHQIRLCWWRTAVARLRCCCCCCLIGWLWLHLPVGINHKQIQGECIAVRFQTRYHYFVKMLPLAFKI